jgi:two-component system cell cycle response regulator
MNIKFVYYQQEATLVATTILIAEESGPGRSMLTVLLSSAGYHVVQFETFSECLDHSSRGGADLILVSLHLRDGNAESLPERLRRRHCGRWIPVIGLGKENDHAARLRALGAGLDDVLLHPIQDRLLLARISNLLEQSRSSLSAAKQRASLQTAGPVDGLQEPPSPFVGMPPTARVAILKFDTAQARNWERELTGHADLELIAPEGDHGFGFAVPPDCIITPICTAQDLLDLQDLYIHWGPQGTRLVAIAEESLAADTLKHGAHDVLTDISGARELLIRVRGQLWHKSQLERHAQCEAMKTELPPSPILTTPISSPAPAPAPITHPNENTTASQGTKENQEGGHPKKPVA